MLVDLEPNVRGYAACNSRKMLARAVKRLSIRQRFVACAQGHIAPSRHGARLNQGPASMCAVGSAATPQHAVAPRSWRCVPCSGCRRCLCACQRPTTCISPAPSQVAATEHPMRLFMPTPSPAPQAPAVWHAPAGWRPRQDWVACGGAAATYARPDCR